MAETRTNRALGRRKAARNVRVVADLDRRTRAMRAMCAWETNLTRDCADVSEHKKTLIELAARTWLLLNNADAFVLELNSIVNKRKRALWPIVSQRMELQDTLTKLLALIGQQNAAQAIPKAIPEDLDAEIERLKKALQTVPEKAAD